MTSFSFLIRYSWELPCMDMLYIYLCQWTFVSWEKKKHMKKEDGKEYKKKIWTRKQTSTKNLKKDKQTFLKYQKERPKYAHWF